MLLIKRIPKNAIYVFIKLSRNNGAKQNQINSANGRGEAYAPPQLPKERKLVFYDAGASVPFKR
jgi:hypothetical protein